MKLLLHIFGCLVIFGALAPTQAHAYLDPGTGSMILQGLAAGLIALLAFWSRVRALISNFFKKDKSA